MGALPILRLKWFPEAQEARMLRRQVIVSGCLTLALASGLSPQIVADETKLLVPAYFYPAGKAVAEWERLFAASQHVPLVVIVNPASGPGKQVDPNYTRILKKAQPFLKNGRLQLLGYVTTSYAKRDLKDILLEVDRWQKLYPGLHGYFLDEQASDPEHVSYYVELFASIAHRPGMPLVISNPGVLCHPDYFEKRCFDAACIYEGADRFDRTRLNDWPAARLSRSALLFYGVSNQQTLAERLRQALPPAIEGKGPAPVGYVFVTDGKLPNPWDRLPNYWDALVATLRKHNAAAEK